MTMVETGPICCRKGCDRHGTLHLYVGAVEPDATVTEASSYTGGTFCSWDHLSDEVHRIVVNNERAGEYMTVPLHTWRRARAQGGDERHAE